MRSRNGADVFGAGFETSPIRFLRVPRFTDETDANRERPPRMPNGSICVVTRQRRPKRGHKRPSRSANHSTYFAAALGPNRTAKSTFPVGTRRLQGGDKNRASENYTRERRLHNSRSQFQMSHSHICDRTLVETSNAPIAVSVARANAKRTPERRVH